MEPRYDEGDAWSGEFFKESVMRRYAIGLLVVLLCSGCTREKVARPPAGSPLSPYVRFEFALYLLEHPRTDLRQVVEQAATGRKLRIVEEIEKTPDAPQMAISIIDDAGKNYTPPDVESLRYFGHGLEPGKAEEVQKASTVVVLEFSAPRAERWALLRSANEIALAVAMDLNALLWDEETREMFSPQAWRESRVDSWTTPIPDVSKHFTIHAYKNDEYVRAITLGMAKFGAPDVVVDDFAWSLQRPVGNLINAACQLIAEGREVGVEGAFEVDLHAIRCEAARARQLQNPGKDATQKARLQLSVAKRDEGDPANRIVALQFDEYDGPDMHSRREAALSSLYGSFDAVARVSHTDELVAESERARRHLPALEKAFNAGLRPGENIQLKAPFRTAAGGKEWMWVEVVSWKGDEIRGLLQNDPYEVPYLRAGQVVKISEREVFDYIRHFPDGHDEGNTTGAILRKQSKQP